MMDEGDDLLRRSRERVGTVLKDKWRLDRLLGVGGMAAVYEATHRNGKRAAVKMLHVERSIDRNIRSRFLREGYVANKVNHPGAVSILDDDATEDGAVFLVMELLEGESLQTLLAKNPQGMAPGLVLSIADQVLAVLEAAHTAGIVHRDLKPDNLFRTTEGVIKVLDFGIARLRELTTKSNATGSSASLGTPAFMPPEQARGRWELVDATSDLWAVGATMFTLLTGRHVHEAPTVNEHLLAAMTLPAPKIAAVQPEMPEQVALVVDRALAFERKDRWKDAAEMRAAVRDAYLALEGTALPTVVASPEPSATAGREAIEVVHDATTLVRGPSTTAASAHVTTIDGRSPRRNRLLATFVATGGLLLAVALFLGVRGSGGSGSASVTAAPDPTPSSPQQTAIGSGVGPGLSRTAPATAEPTVVPATDTPGPGSASLATTKSANSAVSPPKTTRGTATAAPSASASAKATAAVGTATTTPRGPVSAATVTGAPVPPTKSTTTDPLGPDKTW